ncbi:hypothetical protein XELAEV_18003922mg [Xenopus laevis]|uniref:Uncharacterized protein n=1 Tax=Xenopus laevis TaxID=8355 RepID=A0A974BMX3_XENLA|nr:hypothetical protein XELAEV_18003922mg [Xenopus laevis]
MEQILLAAVKKNTHKRNPFRPNVLFSQRDVALCCTRPHSTRILTVTTNNATCFYTTSCHEFPNCTGLFSSVPSSFV